MQIVIDIPNGCYEEICNARFPIQDGYRLVAWIKDGTPLPKENPKSESIETLTRWIPVSEDLPKDHDWYLAVFREKDTGYQLIPRVASYINDNTWIMLDEEAMVQEYRDILECVAWMPLPKPYKAESEE